MSPATERRLLQAATLLTCLVSLAMGATSVWQGPGVIRGVEPPWPVDLDSHYRYLSGLLLGIALTYVACVPTIERRGELFRALCAIVVMGGLARLLSFAIAGEPGAGHRIGLAIELGVVPLITLWQARLARRFQTS